MKEEEKKEKKTFDLILPWDKLQQIDKLIAEMPYKYGFPIMQLLKSCEKIEE